MIGMFCDVLQKVELCGRRNGRMDAGRCYSQLFVMFGSWCSKMWQMEWPLWQMLWSFMNVWGNCYANVADAIATVYTGIYFILKQNVY